MRSTSKKTLEILARRNLLGDAGYFLQDGTHSGVLRSLGQSRFVWVDFWSFGQQEPSVCRCESPVKSSPSVGTGYPHKFLGRVCICCWMM
jgi:hypothetical protein